MTNVSGERVLCLPKERRLKFGRPKEAPVNGDGKKGRGFSIFRSAGEEAEMRDCNEPQRDNEGGHMSCTTGRIVSSPGAEMPFTAVMTREDGSTFEVTFVSMGEAEAFIRRNTPRPADRSTTYDHQPE